MRLVRRMPRMQVYLPDDLYEQAKTRHLPASKLLQEAGRAEVRRRRGLVMCLSCTRPIPAPRENVQDECLTLMGVHVGGPRPTNYACWLCRLDQAFCGWWCRVLAVDRIIRWTTAGGGGRCCGGCCRPRGCVFAMAPRSMSSVRFCRSRSCASLVVELPAPAGHLDRHRRHLREQTDIRLDLERANAIRRGPGDLGPL